MALSRLLWVRGCMKFAWLGFASLFMAACALAASPKLPGVELALDRPLHGGEFPLVESSVAAPMVYATGDAPLVRQVVKAFAEDLRQVSGTAPEIFADRPKSRSGRVVLAGTLGHNPLIDRLIAQKRIDVTAIRGQWEAAQIDIVDRPFPGVRQALVVVGSDRRGLAFALFDLSRRIGVSPWAWWADVPVQRHASVAVVQRHYRQSPPSVQYRGIFINDEDWGIRPWAAKKMDPEIDNIGPHTYARVFELLLRLHANTLWPAMHPGSTPFHSLRANTLLADQWGIVMGSSHSEALTRNNVGEWNEARNGPWNYQKNKEAIDAYWNQRLDANGRFENMYTVGMRGVHDGPLEATGTKEQKARLVEQVMADQQKILARHIDRPLAEIPQVVWLYKEALELYDAGMKVPPEVTLGWTDDNYGYLRRLPNAQEQKHPGGSALYYHVSYWGAPYDYLWLCTTPPALMREELTKAWDHDARRMWILNVGDIKPAESDIDYFLRFAWQEERMSKVEQKQFLEDWFAEQFSGQQAAELAAMMEDYYHLTFVRKPEFMGFNSDNDDVKRTAFNPLAWGDQNRERREAWQRLSKRAKVFGDAMPQRYRDAYFELVGYPIQAAAEQNAKFLWTDRSYLDASLGRTDEATGDGARAEQAYREVQKLTEAYNSLHGGKWHGMMSAAPREQHVFELPRFAAGDAPGGYPLPQSWGRGVSTQLFTVPGCSAGEQNATISVSASDFDNKKEASGQEWRLWNDLGLSGAAVSIANMGAAKPAAWVAATGSDRLGALQKTAALEYCFASQSKGESVLTLFLLPTFPVDSDQRLRYAVAVDDRPAIAIDAALSIRNIGAVSDWSVNVLRNAATQTIPLGKLEPGQHKLTIYYGDPGVVFEHWTIVFPGAPPAYPFPEPR